MTQERTDEELKKLEYLVEKTGESRSDILRYGVDCMYRIKKSRKKRELRRQKIASGARN